MSGAVPSRPMRRPRIAVVGDLILDRYTWGDAERISPEAPVPVLRADREEIRPGGAASVASLLRGLEADVHLFGVLGDDSEGAALRRILEEQSIGTAGLVASEDRPTTSKHRFVGRAAGRHPHQILRVDREQTSAIEDQEESRLIEAVGQALPDLDALLISDYAKGVCTLDLLRSVIEAANGARCPVLVDPGRGRDPADYYGAALLKPNRMEAETLLGRSLNTPEAALSAAQELRQSAAVDAVVITLDRDGLVYATQNACGHAPTTGREAYDITGAGDMVLAVLGYAAAAGWDWPARLRAANAAAGLQIERFGIAPVSWPEIEQAAGVRLRSIASDKIVSAAEAGRIAAEARGRGRRIVFTNGCFDLLHAGHVTTLEQAAALGDLLIVAVNSDESVRRLKGGDRPIISAQPRALMVAALSCTDFVVVFDDDTPHRLLDSIRPDVLIKGGTTGDVVGGEFVEAYGGRVVRLPTALEISTTRLIEMVRRSDQSPRHSDQVFPNPLIENGNPC